MKVANSHPDCPIALHRNLIKRIERYPRVARQYLLKPLNLIKRIESHFGGLVYAPLRPMNLIKRIERRLKSASEKQQKDKNLIKRIESGRRVGFGVEEMVRIS